MAKCVVNRMNAKRRERSKTSCCVNKFSVEQCNWSSIEGINVIVLSLSDRKKCKCNCDFHCHFHCLSLLLFLWLICIGNPFKTHSQQARRDGLMTGFFATVMGVLSEHFKPPQPRANSSIQNERDEP